MESCCSVRPRYTPAVVLLVQAFLGQVPVYGFRQVGDPAVLGHYQRPGSLEYGETAVVQTGPELVQNRSASAGEQSPAEGSACFQQDVGSRSKESQVWKIRASLALEGLKECQFACQTNPACTHYTYTHSARKCYLKRSAPEYHYHPGDQSGTRNCNLNQQSCFKVNTGSTAPDMRRVAIPAGSTFGSELLRCQAACKEMPECNHFSYNSHTKRCFLKKESPRFREYQDDMSASRDCDLGSSQEVQAVLDGRN
ncbi:microneme protein mic4 [Cystoisospora suis]|uniref:Microneme protein mic4 n=1 Tax=Cystoisospora suis TaxID=483139 RepID=A0A2C6KWX7_9APIC|nr:microneme protein mic4 [Cystoisospora suis]